MKKTFNIVMAGLAALLMGACEKTTQPSVDDNASALLTVVIDSENGTKATLKDSNPNAGAFAFSSGDKIKVYDGTGTYVGTTTSNANEALFSVEKPFNNTSGSGWVAFPADIVTGINASSITFILPTSYSFSQVGSSDPDASKAPVPMIGAYSAGNKVTLKQAGAVMRFRFAVGDIGIGNISFSFGSNVTGQTTISSPDPGTSSISSPSVTAGSIITVSISRAEWDTIKNSTYAYVTLPVPAGLTINNSNNAVLVTFASVGVTKVTTIAPTTGSTLGRAEGYKASASFDTSLPQFKFQVAADPARYVVMAPGNLMAHISEYHYVGADEDGPAGGYAVADEWKFGGYFEYIGAAHNAGNYLLANAGTEGSANATALIGKWVDLFPWQGESAVIKAHGLVNYATANTGDPYTENNVKKWHGDNASEVLYPGCWETDASNGNTAGYIHISNGEDYHWRLMTKAEWSYLLYSREGSLIGTYEHARHGRVKVAGVHGLLIFPDGITWRTTAQGGSSNCGSADLNTAMTAIADEKGVPTNLNINGTSEYNFLISYSTSDMSTMSQAGMIFLPGAGFRNGTAINAAGQCGYYWSSNAASQYYTSYLIFNNNLLTMYDYHRFRGRCVRLVRDVD